MDLLYMHAHGFPGWQPQPRPRPCELGVVIMRGPRPGNDVYTNRPPWGLFQQGYCIGSVLFIPTIHNFAPGACTLMTTSANQQRTMLAFAKP